MIKAILLDFDQTLVDSTEGFRYAEKEAQKKIFENICVNSWEDFLSVYRPLRKQRHAESKLSRKALWEEVYWHYCRDCDLSLLEQWEDEYWQAVKERTVLFPDTLSTLRNLAGCYKLGAISNTQAQAGSQKHRLVQMPQVMECFETVIIAGEEGVPPKPDSRVFLACLEHLDVDPSEAVFVGDDWRSDICGATDAGLHAVWIKHHQLSRSWPEPDRDIAAPVITSLESLLEIDSLLS